MVHLVQIKTIPIKNIINQSNNLNSISKKINNLIENLEKKSNIKFNNKSPKAFIKKTYIIDEYTIYNREEDRKITKRYTKRIFPSSYFTAALIISLKDTIKLYDNLSQEKQINFKQNPIKFLFTEYFNPSYFSYLFTPDNIDKKYLDYDKACAKFDINDIAIIAKEFLQLKLEITNPNFVNSNLNLSDSNSFLDLNQKDDLEEIKSIKKQIIEVRNDEAVFSY